MVKIGPVVLEKKMLTDDRQRTTDKDCYPPMAIGHLSDSPHKNSKMKSKSFLRKSLYLLYISFTDFANMLDLGIAKVCSIGPPTPELVGADGINLGIKLQIHKIFSLELSYKIYMQEPS